MALDFPDSPTVNQIFTAGLQSWIWNGATWNLVGVPGIEGPTGPIGPGIATFTHSGTLSQLNGTSRWYSPFSLAISNIIVSVGNAPTGSSVIIDINKNGSTIFTTQENRPTITATNFADTNSTPDVTSLAAGDYLSIDIDQVGSTAPGSDLVVQIIF